MLAQDYRNIGYHLHNNRGGAWKNAYKADVRTRRNVVVDLSFMQKTGVCIMLWINNVCFFFFSFYHYYNLSLTLTIL